ARIHLGKDGSITVLAGKVEGGQGARAEITQAAAEELGVAADRVQAVLGDTGMTPDDGITAGSGTSPRTIPAVRQAAAAARQLLIDFACKQWGTTSENCELRDGKVFQRGSGKSLTYADLAANEEVMKSFTQPLPAEI